MAIKMLDRRATLEWQAMLYYLTTKDCRRLTLEAFMDDVAEESDKLNTSQSWGDCTAWGKEICDVCKRKALALPPKESKKREKSGKMKEKNTIDFEAAPAAQQRLQQTIRGETDRKSVV